MFDFLNKLSHQHQTTPNSPQKPPKYEQNTSQQFNQPPPQQQQSSKKKLDKKIPVLPQKQTIQNQSRIVGEKPKKRQLSLSAQLQMGEKAELDPQVLQILLQIQDQSQKRLRPTQLQMTQQQRGKVQKKVYLREMSHNFEQYLEQILVQSSSPNRYVRYGLAQMVDHVANSIFADIMYTQKYQISKKTAMNKDQLALLEKSISHIRNNEGNIRQKVGQLKLQLQNESTKIHDRSLEIINNKNTYSAHHPKTKEVQQFLKSLQMERMQQRMRYEESLEHEKARKRRQEEMMELDRERARSERHQRLAEAHQIKKRIRQEELQAMSRKNEQFQQYLKSYKKTVPLYKQKQKQFVQKFVKQENQQRYNKLLMRKQNYEPISFDDIEDHEQRYMDYKKDNQIRKRAEVRMQKEAEKRRQQELDGLHKGQFRYYVLEELVAKKEAKDPKQDIINKKIRQLAYSQNVKQLHKPKVDQMKKMQMEMLLNSSSAKRRRKYRDPNRVDSSSALDSATYHRSYSHGEEEEERDPRKQGERNRRYFKQYIRQKIQKGEIKNSQAESRPLTLQPKPNYLQQLRSSKQKQSRIRKAQTIDHQIESIKKKQDISALLARVDHHDLRAHRLEEKFKHAMRKPEEEAALEDNYLFSIKAKLELIRNYD